MSFFFNSVASILYVPWTKNLSLRMVNKISIFYSLSFLYLLNPYQQDYITSALKINFPSHPPPFIFKEKSYKKSSVKHSGPRHWSIFKELQVFAERKWAKTTGWLYGLEHVIFGFLAHVKYSIFTTNLGLTCVPLPWLGSIVKHSNISGPANLCSCLDFCSPIFEDPPWGSIILP